MPFTGNIQEKETPCMSKSQSTTNMSSGNSQIGPVRRRSKKALETCNEFIGGFQGAATMPDLLDAAMDATLGRLDLDAAGICLVRPGTVEIVLERFFPAESGDIVRSVPLDAEPYSAVFIEKQPIVTARPAGAHAAGIRAIAHVPLLAGDTLHGGLVVLSMRRSRITGREIRILVNIGKDIGAAVAGFREEEAEIDRFQPGDDLSSEIFVVYDEERRIRRMSEYGVRMSGYREEELLGRTDEEIFPPAVTDSYLPALLRVFETKRPEKAECGMPLHPSSRSVVVHYLPVLDEQGEIRQVIGIMNDNARRLQADAALRDATRRLQELESIVNRSPAIAVLWNASGGCPVEFVSDNIVAFGYPPEEFTSGRIRFADITHPDDRERVEVEIAEHLRGGCGEFALQYRIVTGSNEIRWVEERIWVCRDESGGATHYQAILVDITARVLMDALQQQAYSRIEQNMEQFAVLGDHIRHPLQVIMGRADLMNDEHAGQIREQVRKINEILKRLDQGWVESKKIREYLQRNE